MYFYKWIPDSIYSDCVSVVLTVLFQCSFNIGEESCLKISRHLFRRRVVVGSDPEQSFFLATLYCACVFQISKEPISTVRSGTKQAPILSDFRFSNMVEYDIIIFFKYQALALNGFCITRNKVHWFKSES